MVKARLSGHFLGIVSLVFSKFWHGARNLYEILFDRAGFSGKIFLSRKLENGPRMGQNRLFEFIEKFGHEFLLNLFCKENLYHLLHSWINLTFGNILFLKYKPKCSQPIKLKDFLINHISRTNQWNSLNFWMLIQTQIN